MKKQMLLMLPLILVVSFYINAQHNAALQYLQEQSILPNNTPEKYFAIAASIMQVVYGSDSSESGPMNAYRKFKYFFETRSAAVFDSVYITDAYMNALINIRSRGGNGCGENQFRGNWENIDPRTDTKNLQYQGWVTAIWHEKGDATHPQDLDKIRIGTLGGLWETPDGGDTWVNLTDNIQLTLAQE